MQKYQNTFQFRPAGYLGIDMELTWTIIQRDVPSLNKAIAEIIERKSK